MQAQAELASHGKTDWPSDADTRQAELDQRDTRNAGLFGTVRGVALVDLLQMYHLARQSVVLRCVDRGRLGGICLDRGEIVHAYTAAETGRAALRRLLELRRGLFTGEPTTGGGARSIDQPMQPLLLDLMREIDEDARMARRTCAPSRPPGRRAEADHLVSPCARVTIKAERALMTEGCDPLGNENLWDSIQIGDPALRAVARTMPPKARVERGARRATKKMQKTDEQGEPKSRTSFAPHWERGGGFSARHSRRGIARWVGLAALAASTAGFVAGLLG